METFIRYQDAATGQWRSTGRLQIPGISVQVWDGDKRVM
jgi:hypothetical protein